MPSYKKSVVLKGRKSTEIYEKVSNGIEQFLTKSSIGHFDLKRDDAKKTISIESKMFTGSLTCVDGEVTLQGNLALLAMPFKSKLDEGVDRWTSKVFST